MCNVMRVKTDAWKVLRQFQKYKQIENQTIIQEVTYKNISKHVIRGETKKNYC